ncbi:invasin domain 3-containing protein [Paenibacillus tarimensis]|uniref:invasin domain 3-containing protein n=1 Tax=Paenibacillus tarimensis TaxID=416012 RepID=UPI001F3DACB2|nr:invasin domain 3-containing protein [Paenibacillus tarimensis]MCF2946340.1 S-layer homology domain-containing protein [Paenibacillus tarimensis]
MQVLRKKVAVLLIFALLMPQLGMRTAEAAFIAPAVIKAVGGGDRHSLLIAGDGTVWTLGGNSAGELGDGTTQKSFRPVQVTKSDGTPLTGAKQVTGGAYFSLALLNDGTVWAWGRGGYGSLGNGLTDNQHRAVQVVQSDGTPISGVRSIAAGSGQALAVKEDGSVWGWGSNSSGELTDYEYRINRAVRLKASSSSYLTDVKAVAAGEYHSMALKNDGTVWAWGSNVFDGLGNGSSSNSVYPVRVIDSSDQPLNNVVDIGAHRLGGLALKADGTVWSWGYNENYNLGVGADVTSSSKALQVLQAGSVPLTDVVALAGGKRVTMALKKDGSVWWWGMQNSNLRVAMHLTSNGAQMAAGDNHGLVLKKDGTVWGVGWTDSGQLGISFASPQIYVGSPVQVYPARSQITLNKTRMDADGANKALVMVTLLEGRGLPIGRSEGIVQLSSTLGQLGPVTDHGDGTYSAELTASMESGTAVITGTLNGNAMNTTASLYMAPLPPSIDHSTVTASPASIRADGSSTSTITVQLKDANGNLLSSGSHSVQLSTTGGVLGTVQNHGSGRYSASLTAPTTAGSATVTAAVDGSSIRQKASVQFVPGPASAAQSRLTADSARLTAGIGTTSLAVKLIDAHGNPLISGGDTIVLKTDHGHISDVKDQGDGTYSAIYTASSNTGTAGLSAEVNGSRVPGILNILIVPGVASPSASTVEAGDSYLTANGSSQTSVTVQLKDVYGNPLTAGGDVVLVTATAGSIRSVKDNGDGSYTGILTSSTSTGTSMISAEVNGVPLGDSAQVEFLPGEPSVQVSELTAESSELTANGTESTRILVQLKDEYGNPLQTGGNQVVLKTTAGELSSVLDHQDGTYSAVMTAGTAAGTAEISGTVDDKPLADSIKVQLLPGPPAADTSLLSVNRGILTKDEGSSAEVSIQLKDAFGNNLTTDNSAYQLKLASTLGSLTEPVYAGQGRYTAQLHSRQAGEAVITATINDARLTSKAAVTFVPGKPSLVSSTIDSDRERLVANGMEAAQITLQLKDVSGNNLTDEQSLSSLVLFSSLGSISNPVYTGEGKYSARLTSTRSGRADLTAFLDGSLLNASLSIEFVPDVASAVASELVTDRTSVPANGSAYASLTINVRDAHGNPALGEVRLQTTHGTVTEVTYSRPGTYTAELSSTEAGIADIKAWIDGEPVPGSMQVTFSDGIWFTPASYQIPVGESVRTVVEVTYDGAAWDRTSDSNFRYDDGVIQVAMADDGYWYMTGLHTGKTVIEAVYQGQSGMLIASAPVTVYTVPTKLVLEGSPYSMKEGGYAQISVIAEYSDGTTKDVTAEAAYNVHHANIASVDASGRLLGLRPGQSQLTVTFEGLSVTAGVDVSASAAPSQPETGGGGEGGGVAGPTTPVQVQEPAITIELQLDGNSSQVIQLHPDQLAAGRIVIETSKGNREWTLLMKRSALDQLRQMNAAMSLEWRTPLGTMILPLANLDSQGLSADSEAIRISIRTAEDEMQSKVNKMASRLGASLLMKPFMLSVEALDQKGLAELLVMSGDKVTFLPSVTNTGAGNGVTVTAVDGLAETLSYVAMRGKGPDTTELRLNAGVWYTLLEVQNSFVDMQEHWAKSAAELLAARLIVQGTGQGKFEPGRPVTRVELVSMLARMFGLVTDNSSAAFSDVSGRWYAVDVQAAQEAGWIEGYADGTFRPDAAVSRQELFVILARALQSQGYAINEEGADLPYTDKASVAAWAESSVQQLTAAGFLTGDQANNLKPGRSATRAEAAVMLVRMLESIELDR